MMRQMRENTKWIMLATALAFVALMVFDWGMDITGRSGGGLGEIGRVNGDPVMYDAYIATYRNLYDDLQRRQEQAVTSAQNRQLEEEAWNQVVTSILIQQELERRGIRVTDEEIREAALFAPPPGLQADPTFQTNGSFDLQKYQTYLSSAPDEQFLLQLEAYYRDVLPRGKLLRQLTAGVYPTDQELWQEWREQNEKVVVQYVSLDPSTRIPDSEVTVTDREIRDYYETHEDNFQRPAEAFVRVVTLPKAPLPSDSAAARDAALALRQEILGGADFAEVARRESADPASGPQGGSLGTFGRNYMAPALEEAAFSAPIGQVTEPVMTPFGYHLIKVDSRTADSVTASHILVPIQRTDDSELQLLARADSLEAAAERQGLDAASQALGLEVKNHSVQALVPFIAGIGNVGEGADWAMEEAVPGDVSPLFETAEAFYVMELLSATPEGVQSLDEARPNIEQVLRAQKKTEIGVDRGRALAERIRSGQSLNDVASAEGLQAQGAGPFSRLDFVPVLGFQNAAVGAAFGLGPGEVSDPVATGPQVFILQEMSRTPADSAQWEAQKDAQRMQSAQVLQERRMAAWLEEIRETANVVDRRQQVLQPVTEEDPTQNFPTSPFGRR
jgi:peptidyl-prolyl cis-trans isomerase D